MDNNIKQQEAYTGEQEIDIMAIIARLWEKKKFIFKVTTIFAVIGLFVAIFSPKVYTSSCTFVPQSSKKTNSSISSLAALAGINMGNMSSGETLSPLIYPQILDNIDFKKELMYSKINFAGYDEPIALIDYYTDPQYAKFNLIGVIKKYTIGLPGMIIGKLNSLITKEDLEDPNSGSITNNASLKFYSKNEYLCALILNSCVSMSLEEKKGYITIVAQMGEPKAAAQLCQITFDLLQKYVTEFKISKAKNQQAFIQGRYNDTKEQYEEKQRALALFMDANKVISSAQARIELERLTSEYNLANAIYTEMAKQSLQADIQVKEDTPLLAAVSPVVVPYQNSKPKRAQILFIWCFLGVIIGSGVIIVSDWLSERDIEFEWLSRLVD